MKNTFRFHVLGLPHTISSKEYVACAYTQKVVKFCKMMTERGHTVIHYGHEESDLICSEHVTVLSSTDWKISYGDHDWRKHFFKYDLNDHAYQTFYKNAIKEIEKRKQKNDFILPFWGSGVRAICDAHQDLICVEPGIGYPSGHWAKYKIFESYSIYHAYYGLDAVGTCKQNFYDIVIPNYFDPDDFVFSDTKDDYFLFIGRVYEGKGIHTAIETTKAIGAKLIVAGQNALKDCGYDTIPDHVEVIGYADVETRKKLMSNAKGAFVASMYVEPFGGVQVECLFSGTPTITTDWGAFAENNLHGITGYRCRTFEHFTWAAKNIDKINPQNCRDWAMNNFTMDRISVMYEEFFQSVMNIHTGNGFYEPNDERRELDWLRKYYPGQTAIYPIIQQKSKKVYIDCGTHMFQGFAQFVNKYNINSTWECYAFESNPYVYKKSNDIYNKYINDGFDITHLNNAVYDKNELLKVNCAYTYTNDYTHLGSNVLEEPPAKDIKYNDHFVYDDTQIMVEAIKFSDFIVNKFDNSHYIILKLDIEGSEFKVLDDMISSNVYTYFDKIYVEFHERFFDNIEFYEQKIKYYTSFFKHTDVEFLHGEDWDLD